MNRLITKVLRKILLGF